MLAEKQCLKLRYPALSTKLIKESRVFIIMDKFYHYIMSVKVHLFLFLIG